MPYIRIWVHAIWSTKSREKIITCELKPELLKHILYNIHNKGIYIDTMNCVSDHIHMILSLTAEQSVSKCVQLIKGESSHWVNANRMKNAHFEWQDDYIAVSVSESMLDRVRQYIHNQEEHHRIKTFSEEYEAFVRQYGFRGNGG